MSSHLKAGDASVGPGAGETKGNEKGAEARNWQPMLGVEVSAAAKPVFSLSL